VVPVGIDHEGAIVIGSILQAIEREILVSAYRLTVGSDVVGALIRAKERGVDVRLIADRGRRAGGRASGIDPLRRRAYQSGSTIERG
jgi:phosphatidylserine/phosphatidylglycerophosphate/cardiolipin synthase-like enzyme